jgi:hypothetical protein
MDETESRFYVVFHETTKINEANSDRVGVTGSLSSVRYAEFLPDT